MPKFRAAALSNLSYEIIARQVDDGLGNCPPSLETIETVEFAIYLKRCLAEGKKRISFDVQHTSS